MKSRYDNDVSASSEDRGRFSRRTAWDRSPSELYEHSPQQIRGLPLLDLTVTNPAVCGFSLLSTDLLQPLMDQGALFYRPEAKGLHVARQAVAEYYACHGAIVSPEQIILTASTSEGYSHLFRLLCEAGDEILIAQPSYPLLRYLADLSDVTLISYPLFYDYGWWIDLDRLERAITSRTRAIVVVHPNNPTGHPTSLAEREYLYELCDRHKLALIVDEVFLDYAHLSSPQLHSFAASAFPPLMFVLSGLSKIAALPQMKIGWIVALGPDYEKLESIARLELISDTFLSVNAPSQLALAKWLKGSPGIQQQILQRISANCSQLAAARLDTYDTVAGWSAIVRLPQIFGRETAFTTLRQLAVLTHPTHFYGLEDPNRVVISLITPTEILHQAIGRLNATLEDCF